MFWTLNADGAGTTDFSKARIILKDVPKSVSVLLTQSGDRRKFIGDNEVEVIQRGRPVAVECGENARLPWVARDFRRDCGGYPNARVQSSVTQRVEPIISLFHGISSDENLTRG